jgi:DNA-binding HxlR family transcriptional regulator
VDLDALRTAADVVGDRWRLLVVGALLDRGLAFSELEDHVPGISPAVLSARLKDLEAAGLVVAAPYQDRPVRHRYELTGRGASLAEVLRALASWGGAPGRHEACGTALELTWWCPTCDEPVEAVDDHLHRL